MKTMMMVMTLIGMNTAMAGQGQPTLTCYSQSGRVVLDLTSLDSPVNGSAQCASGTFAKKNSPVRYQIQFCPSQVLAEGYSEAQNDAGVWVRLQSFSTQAPLSNCTLFRSIESNGPLTGGHGNGHPTSATPSRGGH